MTACSAVNVVGRSSSARARAIPTAAGSVTDSPESQVSPMPVNAVPSTAPSATTAKSHASTNPSPAPTQVPLTPATTGLGMVVSVVTIGL